MLALTDIFKTLVHSEIEQRQLMPKALAGLVASTSDKENTQKLNMLEQQNMKLAREVEQLKQKLEEKKNG